MEGQYSGVDILEALESAHNYNDYLTRLIRESTESKDLTDFGAGSGTFAKRLREAGCRVLCIEPDFSQRERLVKAGFEVLPNIDSLPDRSEEHTSELQSHSFISYAVFCLKKN